MSKKVIIFFIGVIFFSGFNFAHASLIFTEVMYYPSDSDTTGEWIELYNNGSSDILIKSDKDSYGINAWRFKKGLTTEYYINSPDFTISAGEYIVLADNSSLFNNVSYKVIDSSVSLSNTNVTGLAILDETKARELADKLWAFAAEHIAKHYLKMEDKEAEVKKNTKDPSTGESVYDTVITSVLGVDKDAYFNNLKTRGTVDPTQISTLVAPLYETHQRTDTTKRTSKSIKDNKDADLGLAYLKKLKDKYPEALKPLNIPSRYASVEEVRGLIVTAASAIPRDYPINIAESYKKAA